MNLGVRAGLAAAIGAAVIGLGALFALRSHHSREVERTPETPTSASEPISINMDDLRASQKSAVIVDVRPRLFYEQGHIPHAINIEKEYFARDFARYATGLKHGKDSKLVVYCSSDDCDDADVVARELISSGFNPVYVFNGGWSAWHLAHLPEEKGEADAGSVPAS